MRSLFAFFALATALVGCSSREEQAVSMTTLSSASLQPIALIGETKSGLRVNLEQQGSVEDAHVSIARPVKLTLVRGDRTFVFRADGQASARFRGAFEFSPSVLVISRGAIDELHDGDPTRFVETFSEVVYGDSEKVAPPALSPSWNALVVVNDQGKTTVETVSLRKVRR